MLSVDQLPQVNLWLYAVTSDFEVSPSGFLQKHFIQSQLRHSLLHTVILTRKFLQATSLSTFMPPYARCHL